MTNNDKLACLSDKELLARMHNAAPCAVPWASLDGDERVRFCGQCKKNVYNISEMSEREAGDLIREKEGQLCARFYRRSDGTIMTENCPVGLRRIRNLIRTVALAVLTPLVWIAFIGPADAQGLVGAPVDGGIRYGNQSVGEPVFDESQRAVLTASAVLGVGWLAMRISKRKGGVFLLGLTLFLFFAAIGFMIGMSRGCGFHSP
jgi:hypothetical protein